MVLFSGACFGFGQNKGNTSKDTKQLNLTTGGQTCDNDFSNLCLKKKRSFNSLSSISNTWQSHANLLASTERATSLALTSEEPKIYSFNNLHASCQCKVARSVSVARALRGDISGRRKTMNLKKTNHSMSSMLSMPF